MHKLMRQNFILAGAMGVGSVVLWVASLSLRPASALFPRILLAIIVGCALAIAGEQLVRLRRTRRTMGGEPAPDEAEADGSVLAEREPGERENSESDDVDDGGGHARQWLIAAALVVYVLGFAYLGPYTSTFLLLVGLHVLLSPTRTWKEALKGALLAAALTAVLYGLFSVAPGLRT